MKNRRPHTSAGSAPRNERPERSDRPERAERGTQEPKQTHLLYGTHAVCQAWLNPERTCRRLIITRTMMESFLPYINEAKAQKLVRPQPEIVEREQIDRMLPGAVHQGIALDGGQLPDSDLGDVLREADGMDNACVILLDQVTDPHNVGAIMRSAAAFGALAVIMPERNAPPLTGVLAKTACGAVDAIPLVRVNNFARAMDELKQGGFWTVGLDETGEKTLGQCDLTGKTALVMGAEGEGLRRLTMEGCDFVAKLPTLPPIGSLNVSNAAAVALYEVKRQEKPAS